MDNYIGIELSKRTSFIINQIHSMKSPDLRVLDIGCGTGSIPQTLGLAGYKVTAVDLDLETIIECRQNNRLTNVEYITANAEIMELNKKFDVAICSEIIEHAKNPEAIMQNMYEHIEDDGVFIVSSPNGWCLWEVIVSRFLQKSIFISWLYNSPKLYTKLTGSKTPFYSKNVFCFHVNFFTYGGLIKMLKRNGFKVKSVRHSSLGVFPEWGIFRKIKMLECKIADYIPHQLVGGWLLVLEKEKL